MLFLVPSFVLLPKALGIEGYMPRKLYERKMKRLQALMDDLEEAIQSITDEMDEVITSCPVLFRQRENC